MLTRILAILAPGVFLFFTACSGKSEKPPQPKEADFDPALINNLYQQTLKAKQACAAAYQEPLHLFAQQLVGCSGGGQPGGIPIPGNPSIGGPVAGGPIAGGLVAGGPGNGFIPQPQYLAAGGNPNSYYGAIPGNPGSGSVTGTWGGSAPQPGAPVRGLVAGSSFDPFSVALAAQVRDPQSMIGAQYPGAGLTASPQPGVPGQAGLTLAPQPGIPGQGGIFPGAPVGSPFPGCGIPKLPQPTKDASECTNLVKDVLGLFFTLRSEGKGKDGKPGKVVYYSTLPEAQAWLLNEVGSLLNQMGNTAQSQVPGLNIQDPAMANMLLGGAGNMFLQNAGGLGYPGVMNLFSQAVQSGGGLANPALLTQLIGAK